VLPLVLVSVGISGAWMMSLRIPQMYSTALAFIAAMILAFLWQRVFRPAACDSNSTPCGRLSRVVFWFDVGLLMTILLGPLWAPMFY
jgi:mercuric ion transport protein